MIQFINANSLQIPLADKSVQCVVTSPPYWALRDYGVAGQLGLEASPFEYIERMVEVFREVWRVLRDDGVLFLNIGDSYVSAGGNYAVGGSMGKNARISKKSKSGLPDNRKDRTEVARSRNLKPKDLVGIPWRLAFALQADGWYLRSDIIWSKPNPMPESVTDRPTKAHEYIFLLTKNERYFYDGESIKEASVYPNDDRKARSSVDDKRMPTEKIAGVRPGSATYPTRNRRSVWTVPTNPYSGAHFATFPPALVEPMIKAGTSPQACEHCGAPWGRVIEKGDFISTDGTADDYTPRKMTDDPKVKGRSDGWVPNHYVEKNTTGWQPTCKCQNNTGAGRCIVLDPFVGSGTTLQVSRKLGRSGIGLDLSFTYLRDCARERLSLTALDDWENGAASAGGIDNLPLFEGIVSHAD
jgi:DNA modification methylase